MAIIEPPPGFRFEQVDFGKIRNHHALLEYVQKANEHYYYWDRFKHYPFPADVQAEEVWAYLRFSRWTNSRIAPFTDREGRPFRYWIPDTLSMALSAVDRGAGEVLGTDDLLGGAATRYVVGSLMEEAIASSQLEGAATTRVVAKDMLRSGRKPTNKSEWMILNNWTTMQYVRSHIESPITVDEILHLHALVTHKTMDDPDACGRLRKVDDIVVEYNQETVHVPPRHEVLQERLGALCKFANTDDDRPWIHPVVKASMLHFWLAYDHPFEDGNGRTARALFYWYLLSRKYALFQYLPISRFFVRAPSQYMRSFLYTETDGNDLTYFLHYNIRSIQLGLKDLRIYLRHKQEEVAASSASLKHHRVLNARQKSLLHHALRHPDAEYTVRVHQTYHDTAYATARADLQGLQRRGFLRNKTRGKQMIFSPAPNLSRELKIRPAIDH